MGARPIGSTKEVPAVESVLLTLVVVLGFALLVAVARGVRIVQQYETGIVFRLGRIQQEVRGPGLHLIVPIVDRMQKVNMQIVTMGVPAQEGITRDNVSVRVDAVVYFRVIDPIKAVVNVQNYLFAVSQVAQTSLRSVIGQSELDQLLSDRDALNAQLKAVIDEPTEGPWGIRIERVEIKDVALPEGMKRSMSRQAEAERERRARIITADGEFQASKRLAAAARQMSSDPAALQLRMLQTVVEVAAEKNSTLVMPLPVELLRFFDKMAPAEAPAATQKAEEPEPVEEALDELPAIDAPADLPGTAFDVPAHAPRPEPRS
ncbi:slipin family protein [Microbispora sp. NPDC046933]|uniref:slipin family protein n=1 Tax=Microbispora sp. NPDC046933 TaxID=3155618 RepID=UPI003408CF4C